MTLNWHFIGDLQKDVIFLPLVKATSLRRSLHNVMGHIYIFYPLELDSDILSQTILCLITILPILFR